MGTCVSYGIILFYLPPDRGDVSALTPAVALSCAENSASTVHSANTMTLIALRRRAADLVKTVLVNRTSHPVRNSQMHYATIIVYMLLPAKVAAASRVILWSSRLLWSNSQNMLRSAWS